MQFESHEVARIVDASRADLSRARPPLPHHHDHHRRPIERVVEHMHEVLAGRDVIDVEEQSLAPEVRAQRVVQPADVTTAVVTTVADESWD